MERESLKSYLGDSVYADFDGFHVVLTTENGYGPNNQICLDDQVVHALLKYIEKVHEVVITIKPRSGQ